MYLINYICPHCDEIQPTVKLEFPTRDKDRFTCHRCERIVMKDETFAFAQTFRRSHRPRNESQLREYLANRERRNRDESDELMTRAMTMTRGMIRDDDDTNIDSDRRRSIISKVIRSLLAGFNRGSATAAPRIPHVDNSGGNLTLIANLAFADALSEPFIFPRGTAEVDFDLRESSSHSIVISKYDFLETSSKRRHRKYVLSIKDVFPLLNKEHELVEHPERETTIP